MMLERRDLIVPRTIAVSVAWALSFEALTFAHIIPPEVLHPVAGAYRRCTFLLNLNPVRWEMVRDDAEMIEDWLRKVDPKAADRFDAQYEKALAGEQSGGRSVSDRPQTRERKRRTVFELCTRAVARNLVAGIEEAIRAG